MLRTYGPNPRAPSAVGNAEGLVQVQVAHICTDEARGRQRDLRIHICAVHVNLFKKSK